MSLLPGGEYDPMAMIFGNRGPSWLPQGQRSNPFPTGGGPLGNQQQPGIMGILGRPETQDLALSLLANSGYSPNKRSFGEILGTSALQAKQMGAQRADAGLDREYKMAQIQAMGAPKTRKLISVLGADGKPTLKYEDEAAGMTPYAGGADSRPSAFIQAYDRYLQGGGKLGMMEFAKEFAANNAQYPYALGEQGGIPSLIPRTNPTVPSGPLPVKPLSNLPREADAKRVLADAGAAGKTLGEAVATAQIDLPRMEDNAGQMLKILDRLETHPGRKQATGASSMIPAERLAGTDARDFVALLKQVGGKQFLEAYNTLKGGGAITEIEGAKAETAISTIQDRGQSEEAWLQAADDLREVVASGLRRAKRKAQAGNTSSENTSGVDGPKKITGDADYNALPSGTEFIGPDGKRRRKP
jgi:hypothetical protein